MKIIEKQGNVLDISNGVIIHGCNSHGVMGSGIAKEVRARFPGAYKVYVEEYVKVTNEGLPGLPLGSFTYHNISNSKIIINAVTQQDYGREPGHVYVDYNAIALALFELFYSPGTDQQIKDVALEHGLHFPLIGCGLANGDWNIVAPIIEEIVPITVAKNLWIFKP